MALEGRVLTREVDLMGVLVRIGRLGVRGLAGRAREALRMVGLAGRVRRGLGAPCLVVVLFSCCSGVDLVLLRRGLQTARFGGVPARRTSTRESK
jgi:hypothetical protein